MSSKKSFNKGLEAGLRISEGILNKELEAMDYLKNKIDSIAAGQDNVRNAVNDILEYQNSLSVEKYYGVCNAENPKDMQEAEKHVLLDILATLSFNRDTNKLQKMYFANLKHYLEFVGYQPNTQYNFELIDNIRDLDSQEIILKCIREFGFLENLDFTFVDEYEDLLDCFSVKNKRVREIDNLISITDYLFGEMGIVQMYGDHLFIVENKEEACVDEELIDIKLEELILSENMTIGENEERIFENKAICFRGNIECRGRLVFRNCQLHYYEESFEGRILARDTAQLEFDTCVIRSFSTNNRQFFIRDGRIKIIKCIFEEASYFMDYPSEEFLQIEDSEFINCYAMLDGREVFLKKSSKMRMAHCYILCEKKPNYIDESIKAPLFKEKQLTVHDCKIIGKKEVEYNENFLFSYNELFVVDEIRNCSFENLIISSSAANISGCTFENCHNVIKIRNYRYEEKSFVENCTFVKCKYIMDLRDKVLVKDCEFAECESPLIMVNQRCHIENCCFYNITITKGFEDSVLLNGEGVGIFFFPSEGYIDSSSIKQCIFKGIRANDGFLIAVDANKNIYPEIATMSECVVEQASTTRTSGSLIKTRYQYFGMFNKLREEIGLKVNSDCKGFFEKFPQEVPVYLNYKLKTKDSFGNHIGANREVERGISGKIANMIYNGMAI